MSALVEAAFGQSTSDTEWDRIKDKYPHNPNAPKPPSNQVDLDPALKELKMNTEGSKNIVPQKEFHPDPIEVVDVNETDIVGIIQELEEEAGIEPTDDPINSHPEKKKTLEETKELIKNFKEKVAKYPKHLSYEGSMVLCVMLSMKEPVHPSLNNLPMVDQTLIKALVPSKFLGDLDYFSVTFDDNKDFNMKFSCRGEVEPFLMTMFNSVAHPRPEDLKDMGAGVVPVEKDGDKIAVGGKILLNKKGIKKLIGVEPLKRDAKRTEEEEGLPRRQPVAGRNAYEIRADVLQMAIDWASREDVAEDYQKPEDVVELAKQFYQFVENRR